MDNRRPRRHILIAARHPSAASGAVSLAAAARRRRLGVEILATGPAFTSLTGRGIGSVYSFQTARQRYPSLTAYAGPDRIEDDDWRRPTHARRLVEQMVRWLHSYLLVSRPSAVVLTDANEHLGADQLLALAANRAGIPSVRVRDAWGTAAGIENRRWEGRLPSALRREALATRYLEIDAQGVEMSARRLGIPRSRLSAVDGLFTLDRLVGRATAARRLRTRRRLGIGPVERIIMFFAQPTRRECAEVAALDAVVNAMNAAGMGPRGVTLATQEHPREADPSDGRLGHNWAAARAVARYEGRVINLTPSVFVRLSVSFEDTMVAADVVTSSYSYSSIETTVLGATGDGLLAAQRPIGVHILPDGVRQRMKATRAGMSITPFAAQGALPHATKLADIAPMLTQLLFQPSSREGYFRTLRRRWHPGRSSMRVIDEVIELVNHS